MGGNSIRAFHVVEQGIDELWVVDADGHLLEDVVEGDVVGFQAKLYQYEYVYNIITFTSERDSFKEN